MNSSTPHILITGTTGTLGTFLYTHVPGALRNTIKILAPNRRELNLCAASSVRKYFRAHRIDAVIHTAAVARMSVAHANPILAMQTNIMGTCRLVEEIIRTKRNIRFIHVSTDGVYPSLRGPYSEQSPTIPYNTYGWTKLGSECAVNCLSNFCIIRSRFFDPSHILFDTLATDSYSSAVPLQYLNDAIWLLLKHPFIGTVNIGDKKLSDYARYAKYRSAATRCLLKTIAQGLPFTISKDSSLDCGRWRKIRTKIANSYPCA